MNDEDFLKDARTQEFERTLGTLEPRRLSVLTLEAIDAAVPTAPPDIRRLMAWWAIAPLAAACVALATVFYWSGGKSVPTPPDASTIAMANWRIEPTGKARFAVLGERSLRLDQGELYVESTRPQDEQPDAHGLTVLTPEGEAHAKGSRFYIGTHPQPSPLAKDDSMNRLTRILILSGMVSLTNPLGSITGNANDLLAAETGKAPVNHAIAANSDFAVSLYGSLAKENQGKNLFYSPYSMSIALAMTAEGARGETADQMGKVLGFPAAARRIGDDAQLLPWNTALIHTGMSELNEQFKPKPVPAELRDKIAAARAELEASTKQERTFKKANKLLEYYQQLEHSSLLADKLNGLLAQVDQYELRLANALFGEKTYPFQPAYLDTVNKFYGTGALVPVDYINNFEAVRRQINTWVEDQTNQRIKDLIAQGSVGEYTRLVLVNAIYFKGDWAHPFDAKNTKKEPFLSAGSKVRVPMMRQDDMKEVRYGAFNADGSHFKTPQRVSTSKEPDPKTLYPGKDGFVVADLPYKGKGLSMVLLVPQDEAGLGGLEAKLTSDSLQTWLGKLESRETNVQMPRFKLETDYQNMKDTLKAMGMVRAFIDPRDPANGAQFDGICNSSDPNLKLHISNVCHKAFLEVNEKGTEAAAATAISMSAGGIPEDMPFTPTFRADRPFLFVIRDNKTGTILFMGRVTDPSKLQ